MFSVGEIVKHKKTGVELVVKSSNHICSTCEYINEKDYIHSKFLNIKSVTKIAICLNENLILHENNHIPKQTSLW